MIRQISLLHASKWAFGGFWGHINNINVINVE